MHAALLGLLSVEELTSLLLLGSVSSWVLQMVESRGFQRGRRPARRGGSKHLEHGRRSAIKIPKFNILIAFDLIEEIVKRWEVGAGFRSLK